MTMKIFSPSDIQTHPLNLWRVVGLDDQKGMALMSKISLGQEGEIAKRISDWAHITPTEMRKMWGYPTLRSTVALRNVLLLLSCELPLVERLLT